MIEDIEPLVKIDDYSLYLLVAVLILFLFLTTTLYSIYKKNKNRPLTKEEIALQEYKEIDFSNPKRAAYLITKYGFILAKDKKSKEIYKRLLQKLSNYKYKKEVDPFDEETIGLYHLFLEVVTHE